MTQESYFEQHIGGAGIFRMAGSTRREVTRATATGRGTTGPESRSSTPILKVVLVMALVAPPVLYRFASGTPVASIAQSALPSAPEGDGLRNWSLPPAPDHWPEPSEAAFVAMGERDPRLLEAWALSGELRPGHLSRAARVLGAHGGTDAIPSLLRLLRHPSPLVREGAVHGLGNIGTEEAIAQLREAAEADPSPGVRAAARLSVEELTEA